MKRRVMSVLTAVSLMLAIAVAGLWVHSGFRDIRWGRVEDRESTDSGQGYMIGSLRGRVFWQWVWRGPSVNSRHSRVLSRYQFAKAGRWTWGIRAEPGSFGLAGFYWERSRMPGDDPGAWLLAIPDYFLIALFLLLPFRWWRKRRRYPVGHCPHCGYDLRATPEPGGKLLHRCPECGRKRMMNDEC